MLPVPDSVREWRDVSVAMFRDEILPGGQAAVLRGAVSHWPATHAGRRSPRDIASYLLAFDTGAPAHTMFGDPAIRGRFWYNDDLTGLNFENRQQPLAQSLDQLISLVDTPDPPAVYVGALPTPAAL